MALKKKGKKGDRDVLQIFFAEAVWSFDPIWIRVGRG